MTETAALENGNGAPAAPATPEEARTRLTALVADKSWSERMLAGDATARAEFKSLTEMSVNVDNRLESVLSGASEAPMIELTTEDGPLTTRNLATAVDDLREHGITNPDTIRQAINGRTISQEEYTRARVAKAALLGNKDFADRLLRGDFAARRDMTLLSIILNCEIEGAA